MTPNAAASTNDNVAGQVALLEGLTGAWEAGDAVAFSRHFSPNAIFVAFDGTALRGPEPIRHFHQQAFFSHLAGTRLELVIEETRLIAPGVRIFLTRGGIRRAGDINGPLIGPSIQTLTILEADDHFSIECFQNTRARSITGPEAAAVWQAFDRAWSHLMESDPT